MADNKTLYGVFNSTMDKVEDSLYNDARKLYEQYKEDQQKKLPTKKHFASIKVIESKYDVLDVELRKLDQKRDDLRNQQRLLNEQENVLRHEIESLDPKLEETKEITNDGYCAMGFSNFSFAPRFYSLKTTEFEALKQLTTTKEFRNYLNRKKIVQKYEDLWTLAISPKQKQQIIIDLQNKIDWHWLGIEIPVLFEVQEVKVVNGEIHINNMPTLAVNKE